MQGSHLAVPMEHTLGINRRLYINCNVNKQNSTQSVMIDPMLRAATLKVWAYTSDVRAVSSIGGSSVNR